MRYLAICCLLMLAIALAHAIPSQRFQGLRSLAKAKSKHVVSAQDTLINKLRSLKTKTNAQRSLQLRQEDEIGFDLEKYTPEGCQDICDFFAAFSAEDEDDFEQKLDESFECAQIKLIRMEEKFQADYRCKTGEDLFPEDEVDEMWSKRLEDDLLWDDKIKLEEIWNEKALDLFKDAEIEPRKGLVSKYNCLRMEAYIMSFEEK